MPYAVGEEVDPRWIKYADEHGLKPGTKEARIARTAWLAALAGAAITDQASFYEEVGNVLREVYRARAAHLRREAKEALDG